MARSRKEMSVRIIKARDNQSRVDLEDICVERSAVIDVGSTNACRSSICSDRVEDCSSC